MTDFLVNLDVDDLKKGVRFYKGIEAAVEKAVSHGATLEKPISTQRWGRLALMADPFGHGFCFVEFLGRGYDEIAE
jgi:uncharacterized glyoxalase superfamily protein PhnB